jgi:hypothetical protein
MQVAVVVLRFPRTTSRLVRYGPTSNSRDVSPRKVAFLLQCLRSAKTLLSPVVEGLPKDITSRGLEAMSAVTTYLLAYVESLTNLMRLVRAVPALIGAGSAFNFTRPGST